MSRNNKRPRPDDEAVEDIDQLNLSTDEIVLSPPPAAYASSEGSSHHSDDSNETSTDENENFETTDSLPRTTSFLDNDASSIWVESEVDSSSVGMLSAQRNEPGGSFRQQTKSDLMDADTTVIQCTEADEESEARDETSESDSEIAESDDESCASEIYFSEEDDVYNEHEDPPVYNGAPISISESMTSILSFVIRHELSGQETIDLLNLVNLHCKEEDNQMKTSLYFFKKYFSCLDCPVVYHYYCSSCFAKVEKIGVCPNAKLHAGKNDKSIFVELPLVPQLQKLFAQEQFFSNLSYRHTRKKTTPENLEDIYDGQLYKELLEFLSESELNFTMMLNTDGVPVFKSSQKSLWPIFLNVMELPPKYRFKKEFTLIAGLWFGCKPEANMILDPLVKSFNCVKTGFHVRPPGRSNSCISKGIVLAATSDLPAKIMLLGMTSYSGAFGCQICKIKGRSVQITKKQRKKIKKKTDENNEEKLSSVWVYPYSDELDLRSHQETKDLGNKAYQLLLAAGNVKIDNLGVKFPSAITQIMHDVIRGFAVDDLHTLYLGVTKTLIKLLFDSKHSSEPYSLRKYLHLVDKRLLQIKLPNVFERCIRKIDGEFSYWKGKECETFIHCLSVAVLDGIMSDKYLEHHIDLVECLHILQAPSISPEKLLACSKKLDNYVKNFEVLYGTRNMSMVIHLLQHLVFVVTNLGPLRYCSCYPYESLNGEILKIIHGTRYVEKQLATGCFLIRQLPEHLRSLKSKPVQDYCFKILHPSLRLKKLEDFSEDTFSVGTYNSLRSSQTYVLDALKKKGVTRENSSVESFLKFKKSNLLFVCRNYTRCLKKNSYTCSFEGDDKVLCYGSIDIFVKVKSNSVTLVDSDSSKCFAIIQLAKVEPYIVGSKQVHHMKRYFLTPEFIAVDVNNLKDMMVCVEVEEHKYVCTPIF